MFGGGAEESGPEDTILLRSRHSQSAGLGHHWRPPRAINSLPISLPQSEVGRFRLGQASRNRILTVCWN